MIGKAIYSLMVAESAITDIVGTRIFPDTVPQDLQFPAIIYTVISYEPSDTKDGVSKLDVVGLQVDIYHEQYSQAQTCAAAVRTLLDRYSGTVEGVVIDSIRFQDQSNNPYEYQNLLHHVLQDYTIRQNRA